MKDRFGNDLKEGDKVVVLYGRILRNKIVEYKVGDRSIKVNGINMPIYLTDTIKHDW